MSKELKLSVLKDSLGNQFFVMQNDTIAYTISKYGSWEGHLQSVYYSIIKKGDTVIDVGANFGYHSIQFGRLVGDEGLVFSYEPHKTMYDILSANILMNGLSNRVYQKNYGLSDSNTSMFLCNVDDVKQNESPLVNYGGMNLKHEDTGNESVRVKKFDDIWQGDVDFLKVDIEGMELNFLNGAYNVISKSLPIIFIEISRNNDDIIAYLKKLGYRLFRENKWSHKMDHYVFHKQKHKDILDNVFTDEKLKHAEIDITEV